MISFMNERLGPSITAIKQRLCSPSLLNQVILALLLMLITCSVVTASPSDSIDDAVSKLVQFCAEPKGPVDEHAATVLVEYVLNSKQSKEHALSKLLDSTGAYYEFDTKIGFSRFMEYSYNPFIPPTVTRPSSLRYSIWSTPKGGEAHRLPTNWKPVPSGGAPVVIHGMQKESDTPDLNTGVYHEYDLKRTLILVNYKGRQALISISKQINRSNVGKKGAILGSDNSWNYFYSGEPGSPRTGLGWVKSYIYDYFSIGVYVEPGNASGTVRSGVFQWLRAGWSGINFVKASHILAGMKRFARDCRVSLESPLLPAPDQIVSVYNRYSSMSSHDLNERYAALLKGQRSRAIQAGVISESDGDDRVSPANTPKEQMLQELMLEYLKMTLGKPTMLGKQSLLPPPT